MTTILLLDADGVVIPKTKWFSTRYAAEFGIPVEALLPFFKNEYRECAVGSKDIHEVLERYLAKWHWSGTPDEFLHYWFHDGVVPEESIIEVVRKKRAEGVKCYLATDQEKYRAAYLWHELELSKNLDGAFFSWELGARKEEPEYWEKVLKALGSPDPATVVFWDDDEENVAAAKSVGIDARLFVGVEDFQNALTV